MAEELRVPKTGYDETEATLVEWLKEEGDEVAKEENLVVLETDKAGVDLLSPAAGILRKIFVEEGDEVVQGQTLAVVASAEEDIEEIIQRVEAAAEDDSSPVAAEVPETDTAPQPPTAGEVEIIPLTGVKKAMADNMLKSKQTSAHGTTFNEADLTYAMQLAKASEKRISVTAIIVKATVDALKAFPLLNSSSTDKEIQIKKYFNISMAVNTDKGLYVPVIKKADEKNPEEINAEMKRLGELAENGILTSEDMADGTFTISNAGRFGSLFFVPIINQPESAILGVGTIQKRPIAVDDQIAIRPMVYISVSYDHRIIPGAIAQQFLETIKLGIEAVPG